MYCVCQDKTCKQLKKLEDFLIPHITLMKVMSKIVLEIRGNLLVCKLQRNVIYKFDTKRLNMVFFTCTEIETLTCA